MVLGILNVKPENVDRDVLFVEALLHTPDIIGTDVIPPALVVSQRPMRRELYCSSQPGVLSEDLVWRGTWEKEDIKDSRLGNPVGLG